MFAIFSICILRVLLFRRHPCFFDEVSFSDALKYFGMGLFWGDVFRCGKFRYQVGYFLPFQVPLLFLIFSSVFLGLEVPEPLSLGVLSRFSLSFVILL